MPVSDRSLIVLLVCFLALPFNVQAAQAAGTIYIRADGRIDPQTANISALDPVTYVFTGNITDSLVIEKDNIVVDGKGYALQGTGQYGSRGIDVTGRTNVTIRNMIITGFSAGIYVENSASGNILSRNEITENTNGIILRSASSNNTVSENQIVGNIGGMDLSGSSNNIILGNNVTDNNYGILLSSASYNTISQNRVSKNRSFGVSLASYSSNNNLSGNNIMSNGSNGLFIWISRTNDISENRITSNNYGLYLEDSSNNTLSRNQLTRNNYGIFLWGSNNTILETRIADNLYLGLSVYSPSSNNSIYHNDFINNTSQADASTPDENSWDNGYPSGGNYWNDYAGVDEKTGLNQDQPGPDGIGDIPYVIGSNNEDRYPLMAFYADVTPPTTTNDYDSTWHTTDFTITLTASDDTSTVADTYYRINDGPSRKVSTDGQPQIRVESGYNLLEYWSRDRAGNEETPHETLRGVKLDRTPPTGSTTINNGLLQTNSTLVTLTVSATDATSGVSQMRFSNDNVTWTSWEPYSTKKPWTLPVIDEIRTVQVQLADEAGLVSQYQDTILLDTTRPSANAGPDRTVNEDVEVAFDASSSTDENGITSYAWTFTDVTLKTLNGRNVNYTFSTPGTYAITLRVLDAAGNSAFHTMTLTVVPRESSSPSSPQETAWVVASLLAFVILIAGPAGILWKRRRKPLR